MSDGKVTRQALAEAVEALRAEVEQLRAERAAHSCHGSCCTHAHVHCNWGHCGCFTVHGSFSIPGCAPAYPYVWTTTGTISTGDFPGDYMVTSVAAGPALPQVQTFSLSN